jgi:hypothetical protein
MTLFMAAVDSPQVQPSLSLAESVAFGVRVVRAGCARR